MEKTGVDTLREVVIFENPKYAFVFEKGSKNYYIEELWGVGKATESDISPEERRACAYFNEEETVSDYFRFLYLQHGVLWPFNRDDFILLNQLPSKEKINEMIEFINGGSDAGCFSMREYCGEVKNTLVNTPVL